MPYYNIDILRISNFFKDIGLDVLNILLWLLDGIVPNEWHFTWFQCGLSPKFF